MNYKRVKLANWLHDKGIDFVLRQKQGTYIRQENQAFQRLNMLNLAPGVSFFLPEIQLTKQKGFGRFNLAGYYKRKYRGKIEPSGWYLLTNLASLDAAITGFKKRSGIEAMFKDCKTGGYNLESTHAEGQRLIALILLIAIAYTWIILVGRNSRNRGIQKYVGRLQELKRIHRRQAYILGRIIWLFVGRSNGVLVAACVRTYALQASQAPLSSARTTRYDSYPVYFLACLSPRQATEVNYLITNVATEKATGGWIVKTYCQRNLGGSTLP